MKKTEESGLVPLGEKIVKMAKEKGFSSPQRFAGEIEMPWSTLKDLLYGKTTGLTEALIKVSSGLGIAPWQLLAPSRFLSEVLNPQDAKSKKQHYDSEPELKGGGQPKAHKNGTNDPVEGSARISAHKIVGNDVAAEQSRAVHHSEETTETTNQLILHKISSVENTLMQRIGALEEAIKQGLDDHRVVSRQLEAVHFEAAVLEVYETAPHEIQEMARRAFEDVLQKYHVETLNRKAPGAKAKQLKKQSS